jgi:hypothetical protein
MTRRSWLLSVRREIEKEFAISSLFPSHPPSSSREGDIFGNREDRQGDEADVTVFLYVYRKRRRDVRISHQYTTERLKEVRMGYTYIYYMHHIHVSFFARNGKKRRSYRNYGLCVMYSLEMKNYLEE